jgi:hypothetical protein
MKSHVRVRYLTTITLFLLFQTLSAYGSSVCVTATLGNAPPLEFKLDEKKVKKFLGGLVIRQRDEHTDDMILPREFLDTPILTMRLLLLVLTEREKAITIMFFGLDGGTEKSPGEIGVSLGLDVGVVSYTLSQAYGRLVRMGGRAVHSSGPEDLDATPITQLGFEEGLELTLLRYGGTTVDRLTNHTAHDILENWRFGSNALEKIRAKLAEHNLRLRGD